MWIWWILSLIVLIACTIFAYRMIVSSYEFLPIDKRSFWRFGKDEFATSIPTPQKESLRAIKNKLQSVEDNATFYQLQFTKLQERLKALEEVSHPKSGTEVFNTPTQEEENWKEMFYEENEAKERLENELDSANQMLEDAQAKLKEFAQTNSYNVQLQSDNDSRFHQVDSLKYQLESLQTQLTASSEREKELEQLLLLEITIREKFSMLQKEYIELQSEADDLRIRIVELSKKDLHHEMRLIQLNELESKLALCEQEKLKLKARLQNV
jgi:multidrug efflux pump subunit AcrB